MMDAFSTVDSILKGELSHGRYHAACPKCGKEPSDRGHTHFSYTESQWFCGVCRWGGHIESMASYLSDGKKDTSEFISRPKKSKSQRINESIYPMHLSFSDVTQTDINEWEKHKPVSVDSIKNFGLRCGFLPTPDKPHKTPRLIVPLVYKGKIWGMKGRLLEGFEPSPNYSPPKWLHSPTSLISTWGLDNIKKGVGMLWVVENYVDAILLKQIGENVISTGGIGGLTKKITGLIVEAGIKKVVIAYDNDNVGCGNDETVRAMNEERKQRGLKPLYPQGPDIAKILNSQGVRAVCRTWPNGTPPKTDMGDVLTKRIKS